MDLNWVITTAVGLMIAALAYFLKKQISDLVHSIEKNHQENLKAHKDINERVDKLENKLNGTLEELPLRYTLREDYIRTMMGFEAKLDKILDRIGGNG